MSTTSAVIKEIKIMLKSLISFTPKRKSDSKNKKTASRKNEKYTMPAKAKMADTQNGIKRTDHKSIMEAKILANTELVECRSNIPLSYLEASLDASPV